MSKGPIGWVAAVWRFVRDVALRWYYGRVGDLAASVTFWLVISLPALVLALLAVLGPLDRATSGVSFSDRIESQVEEFIARMFTGGGDSVGDSVNTLFDQRNNSLAIVSFALVIWSVSRGFAGLIRNLEDIYEIENRRPWYWTRVVAVILGIGSMLISVPLVLMEIYVWGEITDGPVESIMRAVVAIAVLTLWASVLYHYGPAERHRLRFDLPGALVAAIGWWLLTVGFARYVALTSDANEVRAVIGASLLALTWIWLAAQILLVGGAINYLLGERLGVTRGRRTWTINEVVTKGTGEIRKIVVPDRDATPHEIVGVAGDGVPPIPGPPTEPSPGPPNGQPIPVNGRQGAVSEWTFDAAGRPVPSSGRPVPGPGQPVERSGGATRPETPR